MKSLANLNYKLIKAHVLDPENSPLSAKHQDLLDRVISAAKVLDKNPIRKHAVALHQYKFPHISRSQAYEDMNFADSVIDTIHTFDYDYWRTWIMNDIIQTIEKCKSINSLEARQITVKAQANLIKVLGSKPLDNKDSNHYEKKQFYFIINLSKNLGDIDLDKLHKMRKSTIRDLNNALGLTKKRRMKKQIE
jgi:hypothetical protein